MEKGPKRFDVDKFGRSRTFGYPIDIARLENHMWRDEKPSCRRKSSQTFLDAVVSSILEMCENNGNPRTNMIKEEDEIEKDRVNSLTISWLSDAMRRLSKNQELCIYLKFGLDVQGVGNEKVPSVKIRTEKEIGDIIGISQPSVSRHIKTGMQNLKKDFATYLKPYLNSSH